MEQIAVMTPEQLKEFATEAARAALDAARAALDAGNTHADEETTPGKRYVYGLRGIRDLFNVSHPTAQKYKNTFLAPAVMQRGRKIIIDVAKAMELYGESTRKRVAESRQIGYKHSEETKRKISESITKWHQQK